MPRYFLWPWLAGLVLAGTLAVWVWFPGSIGERPPQKPVSLAVYAGDVSTLAYLARDMGLFEKHGVEVRFKDFEAGKLAVDSLVAGQADVATAGELVFITNQPNHPDLRIFRTISEFKIDELFARRDKGINAPKDLKGKKIGVLQKATSEFFLGRFLRLHDLDYHDVEIVYLKPTEIVKTLLSGEIDAGQTWDPHIYHLKRALGDRGVAFVPEEDLRVAETFLLIARDSWLKTHRSAARRFLKALIEADVNGCEEWLKSGAE